MKNKMVSIVTAAAVIVVGAACFCMWLFSEAGSTYYYTRIDNSKMKKVNSRGGVIDLQGGMPYSYTLPAYDENGGEKDITFGASRKLKEGAFICLTVMPVRSVLEWSEMKYFELPAAVRSKYAA